MERSDGFNDERDVVGRNISDIGALTTVLHVVDILSITLTPTECYPHAFTLEFNTRQPEG